MLLKPRFEAGCLEDRHGFRRSLCGWFRRQGRDYPWRRTRDPYAVLVSEVMLQQTQVATVLGKGYYTRFLERFPDLGALASADDEALLKAWEGLGYYRRARMLRETARVVIERHGGEFPMDVDALERLPGVGRYTAGALRAFAFGLPAVLVDGNVARVLARLMDFREQVDGGPGQRQIWEWAGELADPEDPKAYHSALMELGQTCCRPGVPDCLACPVARYCRATGPGDLPVKKPRRPVTAVAEHAVWLRDRRGRVLLHCEAGARRTGLWKLPLRDPALVVAMPVLATESYGITRYKVALTVHDGRAATPRIRPETGDEWIAVEQIELLAMAAPFRRVVRRLLEES